MIVFQKLHIFLSILMIIGGVMQLFVNFATIHLKQR